MESDAPDFDNDGKSFGGFSRTLSDDCVEYAIYVIDATLDDLAIREKLREVQSAAFALTKKHLKDFIWYRETFQLQLVRHDGFDFLHGETSYGDSVDDEWIIVYLLRELSKQFPSVWIRVVDTDGQFLLIEAANALPLWLSPEVADYRVWINSGRLLINPLDNPGGRGRWRDSQMDSLSLKQALTEISERPSTLSYSTRVENEAFYRLQDYPEKIANSLHYGLARVPRKLASILREDPRYISPAVEAFYLRDQIALRPLQAQTSESLFFPPQDMVTMSVKFTKIGFAQMINQKFSAPRSWKFVALGKGNARAKQYAELGMKVTCGFEMLLSDPHNQDKRVVREIMMLLDDLKNGDTSLPNDEEVRKWGMREDDENWLNIDYADLEQELSGSAKNGGPATKGFGDKGTQDHLRRLVSKFEDLLKDDAAAAEHADFLDDSDSDDNDGESSEDETSDPDDDGKHIADPDEDAFTTLMSEMMGMPPEVMRELRGRAEDKLSDANVPSGNPDSADHDARELLSTTASVNQGEILSVMAQMEQELRDAGALHSGPDSDAAGNSS